MPNYIGPKEPPASWQTIRREIYERDRSMCYFCTKPTQENNYTVHHKLMRQFAPESEQSLDGLLLRDGIHNKRNLTTSHPECHKEHHKNLAKMWGAKA